MLGEYKKWSLIYHPFLMWASVKVIWISSIEKKLGSCGKNRVKQQRKTLRSHSSIYQIYILFM